MWQKCLTGTFSSRSNLEIGISVNVLTFEIPMHCDVGFAQNPFQLVQCMDGQYFSFFILEKLY